MGVRRGVGTGRTVELDREPVGVLLVCVVEQRDADRLVGVVAVGPFEKGRHVLIVAPFTGTDRGVVFDVPADADLHADGSRSTTGAAHRDRDRPGVLVPGGSQLLEAQYPAGSPARAVEARKQVLRPAAPERQPSGNHETSVDLPQEQVRLGQRYVPRVSEIGDGDPAVTEARVRAAVGVQAGEEHVLRKAEVVRLEATREHDLVVGFHDDAICAVV